MADYETQGHIPVLLHEAIDGLHLSAGGVFVDCTLGNAGHMLEVWKRFGNSIHYLGIDADPKHVVSAKEKLSQAGCDAKVLCENFRNLDLALLQAHISEPTAILFDLGLNSEQLESSDRGFSFQHDEPLLMTFGEVVVGMLTAREIVNQYDADSLAKIIGEFGEERQAENIARAIVSARKAKEILTTFDLIEAIRQGYRGRYPRSIHFATRTFQALRIAVNDELGALSEGIAKASTALGHCGRIAAISFHSLEDRIVKQFLKAKADEQFLKLITKKPIVPRDEECKSNPRARSAKLRIAEKI